MRVRVEESGFSVNAIAGTNVVLFGFDIPAQAANGLMGFAIRRTDLDTEESAWLPNFLLFEINDHPGANTTSRNNPIQAFQWGDYSVATGQRLRYEIRALGGEPESLDIRNSIQLDITTEPHDDGKHGIWFNRGVAGSQAYTREFGQVSPLDASPPVAGSPAA